MWSDFPVDPCETVAAKNHQVCTYTSPVTLRSRQQAARPAGLLTVGGAVVTASNSRCWRPYYETTAATGGPYARADYTHACNVPHRTCDTAIRVLSRADECRPTDAQHAAVRSSSSIHSISLLIVTCRERSKYEDMMNSRPCVQVYHRTCCLKQFSVQPIRLYNSSADLMSGDTHREKEREREREREFQIGALTLTPLVYAVVL